MDPERTAAPDPREIRTLNARMAARGISVTAPEWSTADRLWEVRIRMADGLAEFARGPSAGHAWRSALVYLET